MSEVLKHRNEEIVKMRLSGRHSLQAIADRFNMTAQRVDQILTAEGVDKTAVSEIYAGNRSDINLQYARMIREQIMLRWLQGLTVPVIAREVKSTRPAVTKVIEETKTEQMEVLRKSYMAKSRSPATFGPRDAAVMPRVDRRWTTETIFNALYALAVQNGGVLPTSIQYQDLSKNRDDLPSFGTVRNRVDRWTQVRRWIHEAIAQNNGGIS